MGIVHNANYFEYFEISRLALIEKYICKYSILVNKYDIQIPVVETSAKYIKPARFQNTLKVTAKVQVPPKKRLVFEYEIHLKNELIAIGTSSHAFVQSNIMKSVEIPEELELILAPHFERKN